MTTLGDSISEGVVSIFTGPFGSSLHSYDYVDNGVPVVPTEAIVSGRLDSTVFPKIKREKAEELSRYELRFGDLVFARRGAQACGLSAMVDSACVGAIAGTGTIVARINDPERIDFRYFSYLVGAPDSVAFLKHHAVGATMPNLNSGIIASLPVSFPPIEEQKAIAAVLGALDDKIELNRRMNATLEAMARALFQSWFVDFDPVRAKAESRPPAGIDAPTAALFPAQFQNSELGPIPKGWTVQPLSKLCSYLSRGIGPAYAEAGGVLVLNQKCIRDHRVNHDFGRRHDDQKKSIKGRLVERFDILVNSTGVGTLGRVAQMLQVVEPTIVDSHVTIVRANSETDSHFLGVNLAGRESEIEELGEGSTGQTELSRVRLGTLPVITPSPEVQRAFGKFVRPIFNQIVANENQSRTLATLRDTLLPKLLSGELSVAKVQN